MADLTGKVYSWQTDYFELYKDFQDVSSFEIITGASIYNFHTLRKLRDGEYTNSTKQIENGVKACLKK